MHINLKKYSVVNILLLVFHEIEKISLGGSECRYLKQIFQRIYYVAQGQNSFSF